MLGKIVKVAPHEGVVKVKALVKNKDGAEVERVNVVATEAVAAVTALIGQEVNLRMKKDEFGSYQVVGVGDYEKPASKGGYGKKGGGFTKAAEDPAKQLMIVKQNALSHATAIAINNAKGDNVSIETVLKIAQPLVDFVVSGSATKIVAETTTCIATKTSVPVEDDF